MLTLVLPPGDRGHLRRDAVPLLLDPCARLPVEVDASRGEENLDRAAFVHRLVGVGGPFQREGEVEDFARIDQLRQVLADGGRGRRAGGRGRTTAPGRRV